MEKNIKEKRKELRLRKQHKGEGEKCCSRGSKREEEEEEEEKVLENEATPDK